MRLAPALSAPLLLCATLAAFLPGTLHAGTTEPPGSGSHANDLPDIGTPADQIFTAGEEYSIGSSIVRQLRDSGEILEDPELTDYVQQLGQRLAAQAHEGNLKFHFFIMKDTDLNAFALPGGFIGVNAGLVTATANESELAGVLAHEISHVTQRHLARSLAAQTKNATLTTLGMLAAVLIGVAAGGSGDAVQGAVAVSQGVAAQQRLNYSRANEAEADRVGMGVLASAGYDPNGMATFFETLGRQTTLGASRIPEFLLTHPVTTNRIAEAKDRAQQFATVRPVDSTGYQLARERVRVLTTPEGRDAREPYADAVAGSDVPLPAARRYGRAIAATAAGDPAEAIAALRELRIAHPQIIPYHTALAEAYLKAGETQSARRTLSEAMTLFPRNVAVTVLYGDTLLRTGEAAEAHRVLLDLFNNVPATPLQIRLLAQAASAQGDAPEANYYAAEYLLAVGDLNRAINQLNRALATPGVSEVQTARFTARRTELREFLPPKLQGYVDRGEPLPEPEYGETRGR
ncbi:MAG: hypothetical protein RJB26_350 [Pseudomonadota bacterium]